MSLHLLKCYGKFFSNIAFYFVWHYLFKSTVLFLRSMLFVVIFATWCYASAAYVVMRCISVCLSVCVCVHHIHSVKTNKNIFEIFSPSGSQAILVFPYQTAWQYSDGNPLNGGVECRWGRQKSRFWAYIWLNCLLLVLQQPRCCQHGRRWTTATTRKFSTHRW